MSIVAIPRRLFTPADGFRRPPRHAAYAGAEMMPRTIFKGSAPTSDTAAAYAAIYVLSVRNTTPLRRTPPYWRYFRHHYAMLKYFHGADVSRFHHGNTLVLPAL